MTEIREDIKNTLQTWEKEPFFFRGDYHEFYTSNDPRVLGVHVTPNYFVPKSRALLRSEKYYEADLIACDIYNFSLSWWFLVGEKMKMFPKHGIKYVFHKKMWTPAAGYDKDVIIYPKF